MKDFFVRIWKNCSNPKSYSEVLGQPFSRSLGFITLLILLFVLIFSFFINLGTLEFVNQAADWIDINVPPITAQNGIIIADVEQPYVREFEGFVFAIDTTGKIKRISERYEYGLLVARDQVHFKRNGSKTEVYDVPVSENEFYLDADIIIKWISIGKFFIFPFIFIFIFAFYWVAILFKIYFYSLIAMLFNAMFSAKLKYGALLNICAYAVTLPFLLSIIIEFIGIPVSWVIYNHLVYVIFLGIIINKLRQA